MSVAVEDDVDVVKGGNIKRFEMLNGCEEFLQVSFRSRSGPGR
jgi:hypothetical protein